MTVSQILLADILLLDFLKTVDFIKKTVNFELNI